MCWDCDVSFRNPPARGFCGVRNDSWEAEELRSKCYWMRSEIGIPMLGSAGGNLLSSDSFVPLSSFPFLIHPDSDFISFPLFLCVLKWRVDFS